MQGYFLKRTQLKIDINYYNCVIMSSVKMGLIILGAITYSYGLIDIAKFQGCAIVRNTVIAVKCRERYLWLCLLVFVDYKHGVGSLRTGSWGYVYC